jgi:uncharacterized damage-inducible protein DinB
MGSSPIPGTTSLQGYTPWRLFYSWPAFLYLRERGNAVTLSPDKPFTSMLRSTLIELFERDLRKLQDEIRLYPDEAALWTVRDDISNSAGNLCLHLIGNLNHFVGAVLGQTGYVRQRDAEFSTKNVARDVLLEELEQTVEVVTTTLEKLPETLLEGEFPVEKHGQKVSIIYMLLHLLTHLNYHLGQVNYHRRLLAANMILKG